MPRRVLVGVAVLAAVVAATISFYTATRQTGTCGPGTGPMAAFRPTDGMPAVPDVSYVDGDGNAHALADLRGGGLVLNFWATWCAPCVAEMPALDRLQGRLGTGGIRVLPLSGDRNGAEAVRAFYAKTGVGHLPVAVDAGLKVARAFKVKGLPTTVLIDAKGRERGRLVGAAPWDSEEAMKLLDDCLNGGRP